MALARRQKCARIGRKSPKISRSQTKSAAKTPNRPPKSAPPISNKPKGLVSGGAQLTATAWKRTLENLARAKIDTGGTPLSLEHISAESRAKFDSVWAFLGGDVSQDIYDSLIHNENNMRPSEINAVFSICDLSDVCLKICDHEKMKDHFGEEDKGKVHSRFLTSVNDFMEMRNDIAHSLNAGSSAGPEIFYSYVSTFQAVAVALAERLADSLPAEQAVG